MKYEINGKSIRGFDLLKETTRFAGKKTAVVMGEGFGWMAAIGHDTVKVYGISDGERRDEE